MKYIICSRCDQKRQVRHVRYLKLIELYGNKINLKKLYVCKKCKTNKAYRLLLKHKNIGQKQQSLNDMLLTVQEVIDIKAKLQKNAEWINQGRLGDRYSRDLFYKMIKSVLSDHKVSDFTINILDNKVVSITLNGLPLLKSYTIGVI